MFRSSLRKWREGSIDINWKFLYETLEFSYENKVGGRNRPLSEKKAAKKKLHTHTSFLLTWKTCGLISPSTPRSE